MRLHLEVQRQIDDDDLPADHLLADWAEAALVERQADVELLIRIVDAAESRQLNREYRGQERPTNVLSFPFEAPAVVSSKLLGDLVICAQVVSNEAQQQGKMVTAHWAHMVVHGVLHLLGHDHQEGQEAIEMERLETQILLGLGFDDPYFD